MSRRAQPVPVIGVVLALVSAGCGSAKLDAKALSHQAKSLRSDAAEGALLAQDAVAGKTTRVYTREHSSELSKAASEIAATLNAATTDPELDSPRRRLAALSSRVSVEVQRLGGASSDQQRVLGRELQAAAQASEKIDKGLP